MALAAGSWASCEENQKTHGGAGLLGPWSSATKDPNVRIQSIWFDCSPPKNLIKIDTWSKQGSGHCLCLEMGQHMKIVGDGSKHLFKDQK